MIKKGLLAVLALVLLILLGLWLSLRAQRSALADRLIVEATALDVTRIERPVHEGSPIPGTTADCLAPLFADAALPDWNLIFPQGGNASSIKLGDVLTGKQPLSALSDDERQALEQARPWAEKVLGCTRMQTVASGDFIRTFVDDSVKRGFSLRVATGLARITAWHVRSLVDQQQTGAALSQCASALAFQRDVALVPSLINAMVAAAGAKVVMPACVAAIDKATDSERAAFAQSVQRIRDTLPGERQMIRPERPALGLLLLSSSLSHEQLMALPKGLLHSITIEPGFFAGFAALEYDRYLESVEASAELPPPDRRDAIANARAGRRLMSLPYLSAADVSYERYFNRVENWYGRLVVLQSLAQRRPATHTVPAEVLRITDRNLELFDDGALETRYEIAPEVLP